MTTRLCGDDMKQVRDVLELTQEGLANALGMSRIMIALYETDAKYIPKRTELALWCLLYDQGSARRLETGERVLLYHGVTKGIN